MKKLFKKVLTNKKEGCNISTTKTKHERKQKNDERKTDCTL